MLKNIKFTNIINCIILVCSNSIINKHWMLFGIYLLMNIIDTITGLINAKVHQLENSEIGFRGIIRKICSWLMILMAFIIPCVFQELGEIINIDLSVTIYLGWFVLASLIVNEYRSILENLVGIGCHVPRVLIKGLEVVSKKLGDADES